MRLNYIDNIDCLEGLKEIPDNSVDLIVTDPPYFLSMGHAGSKTAGQEMAEAEAVAAAEAIDEEDWPSQLQRL